jgi:hypothetical protein
MLSPLIGRTPFPQMPSQVMPQPSPWGGNPPVARPLPIGDPRMRPIPVGPAQPLQASFKKGGKVPKTGKYLLHKGEHVVAKGKRKMSDKKPELVSVAELRA